MVYRCEEKQTQKAFALKVLKKTVRDVAPLLHSRHRCLSTSCDVVSLTLSAGCRASVWTR